MLLKRMNHLLIRHLKKQEVSHMKDKTCFHQVVEGDNKRYQREVLTNLHPDYKSNINKIDHNKSKVSKNNFKKKLNLI